MEEWRRCKGFEDYYEVSSEGNVRRLGKTILRKFKYRKEFNLLYVQLSVDAIVYERIVHILIADTFIPNPKNYNTVRHKDGNRLNNKVDNLERYARKDSNFVDEKTAIEIHNLRGKIKGKELCDKFNISSSTLYKIYGFKKPYEYLKDI